MYTNALSLSTCKDVGHFFQKLLPGSTHRHTDSIECSDWATKVVGNTSKWATADRPVEPGVLASRRSGVDGQSADSQRAGLVEE